MNNFNRGLVTALGSMFLVFVVGVIYILLLALVGLLVAPLIVLAWNGSIAVLFPGVVMTYWPAFWLWVLSVVILPRNVTTNTSKGN